MARKKYKMSDLRACSRKKGLHFFDRETMRFFNSRVESEVIQGPKGTFFITSEKNNGHPRLYTVRKFEPRSCRITTQGKFQEFKERFRALGEAYRAAGVPGSRWYRED